MKVAKMNLVELLSGLQPHLANDPLVFHVGDQQIGKGYHVTELRHSTSTGIDCGGTIEAWQEARLQLLDGPGKAHMTVGKFRDILARSLGKLPALGEAPLLVEYAPENKGLRLLSPAEPVSGNGRVLIELRDNRAVCKPAQRHQIKSARIEMHEGDVPSAVSSCCGGNAEPATREACCA